MLRRKFRLRTYKRKFRKFRKTSWRSRRSFSKFSRRVVKTAAEKKWISDHAGSEDVLLFITTTAYTHLWPLPDKGVDAQYRIGNQISTYKAIFKYQLNLAAQADYSNYVRVAVVVWKGVGSPGYADIFDVVNTGYFTHSQYNMQTSHNYKVIYDKTHHLNPAARVNTPMITVNLKRFPKTFNVTNTNVQLNPRVYIMAVSDSTPGSAFHPRMSWTSIYRYTDA